jgi:three-Cys-motif partner protein
VGGKKVKVSENQIGFDEVASEFHAPVVVGAKKAKAAIRTEALDLAKRPQTWLKLLSLADYLPVWFAKISNLAADAYYLDFFAGPGAYVNGMATAKGSPVLACEAAAAMVEWHAARGRTWTPHLRFVEPDEETRASLAAALSMFDGIIDHKIIPTSAEAALPGLLAESAGSPTLAFFDPFGYDIAFDWVAAFKRPGLTEVLISFDAQAIKRNIAAGQVAGVTDFSGGDWWRAHVVGMDLDLDAYLRDLALHLRRLFPYAGIQQFEFLSNHALRAVAQCCGSIVGRKAWLDAVHKSRDKMALVENIFPELDQQALLDEILERLRPLVGSSVIFKEIVGHLDDLDWNLDALNQAVAFLAEGGFVTWSDRTAAAGHPYRLFRFTRPWPAGLAWDGLTRTAPERPGRTAVTTGR